MASPPATSPLSDHSCDRKRQRIDTPAPAPTLLPSPQQSDPSDTDSAPENDREIIDSASAPENNREIIDSAFPPENDRKIIDSASLPENDREIIDEAFQAIEASFYGEPTESYPTFHFENPSSFQYLQEQLRDSDLDGFSAFVDNKLRFDWNGYTCELLLRLIPTTIHDNFESRVTKEIGAQLQRIVKEDPRLAPFYQDISEANHANITHVDEEGTTFERSPDGQFIHLKTPNPLLIFEVAYAESEKKVLRKAMEYFHNLSDCTLLTFDLTYQRSQTRSRRRPHEAVVSLYMTGPPEVRDGKEHNSVHTVHRDQPFRKAGEAVPGQLKIPFFRFIPEEARRDLPENTAIVCIEFACLAKMLSDAEDYYHLRKAYAETKPPPRPIVLKRENGDDEILAVPKAKRPKKQR